MSKISLNNSVKKKVFNMNCVKLCSRCSNYKFAQNHIISRKILNYFTIPLCCGSTVQKFLLKLSDNEELFNKIIYNDFLGAKKLREKSVPKTFEPLCLKYLIKEKNTEEEKAIVHEHEEKPEIVHFPYEPQRAVLKDVDENISATELYPRSVHNSTPFDNKNTTKFEWSWNTIIKNVRNLEDPNRWVAGLETENSDETLVFGSYNPKKAVSSVPCGGCGALLHCNDPSIPGFIPSEIFENATKEQLQGEICQRCIFLRQLDIALGVNIKDSEYSKIISAIKEKEAMVLLMIDLLDFPCSIYPGILDLFGPKPVVIVGNKVDLLIQEGPDCLSHIRGAMISSLKDQKISLENVKYISLISAKTGYGIENLIDVLNRNWAYKGDIYLVGCTNAGKSTLFNALVQSDFCKIKAADLLHRATVSTWPGTTLNLLKFPITKPTESRMVARMMRLKMQEKEIAALEKLQGLGQNLKFEQIPLSGNVTRTIKESVQRDWQEADDTFEKTTRKGLNPADPDFATGKWFYDTPGVVHGDQIVNLLTTAELMLTVPKKMLIPRNFHLKPGHTLFIGGLARLDYIKGAPFVWFTVFASSELPITVTKLEDADLVYEKLLGSPLFVVPMKGEQRLSKWPKLASKKFEIVGKLPKNSLEEDSFNKNKQPKQADADVVLSSAGWVTINVPQSYRCFVEAWTPEARGLHLREVPIIKTASAFRGRRIPGTPAFTTSVKEVAGYSVTDEPPS